ncbi:MAG: asparagine synthase-related protein, partial [Nitrosopumilaceae archaeon]
SGGLDSRLILAMLIKLGYDNIFTYSYGLRGIWEINTAKEIAKNIHKLEIKLQKRLNSVKHSQGV